MEPLLELTHQENGDDHRNDVSLVSDLIYMPGAEPYAPLRDLLACLFKRSDVPGIYQIRVDHYETDYSRKELIPAEFLRRAYSDEDRQHRKSCTCEEINDIIRIALGDRWNGARKSSEESVQKSARYDSRDDRYEDVSECLYSTQEPVLLLRCCFLDIVLGPALDMRDVDELVIDVVYDACAKNDLKLSACFKASLDSVDILDSLLVDLRIIRDDKAKSRRAVRCRDDVRWASDVV